MSKQTVEIECSGQAARELRGLFQEMARAYDAQGAKIAAANASVPAGYIRNAKGWLIPEPNVKEKDKLEDGFVEAFHLRMAAVSEACRFLKLSAHSESGALVGMIVGDAGGDGSSEAGKVTLRNHGATRRIVIDRRDTVAFGPEVAAAKDKVMACVRKWGEGANRNIVALATMAFQTNASGDLSVSKVASLWRMECDDQDWQAAMAALKESLRTTGLATYLRFHERADPDGKWQLIEARV